MRFGQKNGPKRKKSAGRGIGVRASSPQAAKMAALPGSGRASGPRRGPPDRCREAHATMCSTRLGAACRCRGNACIAPTEQPEQGSRPQVQHMSEGSFFLYPLSGGVPRSGGVGFTDGRSRNPPRPYGPPLQGGDNKTFRWGGVGHERRGRSRRAGFQPARRPGWPRSQEKRAGFRGRACVS